MTDIKITPELTVKSKGILLFDELYKKMKLWLDYQGFGDEQTTFKEERFVQRLMGDSKQLEIRWRAEKMETDYVSYVITVTFFVMGLKEVEVEREGRKMKMNTGEADLRINTMLRTNKNKKFKNGSFLLNIYENYFMKDEIEQHKIELYKKVYSFVDEIKGLLEITTP